MEEKKAAVTKANPYKEMGLEDTSILKRIANVVGFSIGKKGKSSSPKISKSKSAGKSGTAKKKTDKNAAIEMANSMNPKQFLCEGPIPEPMFRYIPDRDTI